MAAPNLKNKHFTEVKRLHLDEGMTLVAIGKQLDIHPVTLGKWFKSEGIRTRTSGYKQHQVVRAAKAGDTKVTKPCRYCTNDFESYEYRNQVFCSRDCTNDWQRENADRVHTFCPCGAEVTDNPWQNKYCSAECRKLYGKKRQPDPANHVTFVCQNEKCPREGEPVTRPKGYGNGHLKFCSNDCARTHTRTRKFYAVDGFDIVFESSWEVLFWGLCTYLKVPVERYDRENGVAWREGCWYAPDFWLPFLGLAVEVKGLEDEDDPARWTAFREQRGQQLVVIDRKLFDRLRAAANTHDFEAILVR
jgi:hypothetical protein